MANRWFNQFSKTLAKEVCKIYGEVTFAAAGAPTLVSANGVSQGILSITRTGAGAYTIVMGTNSNGVGVKDSYPYFLNISHVFLNATAPASPVMYVVSQTVNSPATAAINVQFESLAGAATDPGNGEAVYLEITLRNSTSI